MVEIHIKDGLATFRIMGLHKLRALKSRIVVPVQDIVAVERSEPAPRWAGWRIAGTWLPDFLTAGSFRQNGRWTFWDVEKPDAAIMVRLRGHRYARLIIEVACPEDASELLTRAMARSHASPSSHRTGNTGTFPRPAMNPS